MSEKEKMLTTKLKLCVEAKKGGTVLRLSQLGFARRERWVEKYTGAIRGWKNFLMNFKGAVGNRTDLRSNYDW